MSDNLLAWHWLPNDRRLSHKDGRLVEVGQTLSVEGEVVACDNALHASRCPVRALSHAKGTIACRVELLGRWRRKSEDRHVLYGPSRRVMWMVDARCVLVAWARWCADRAARSGNEDSATWAAWAASDAKAAARAVANEAACKAAMAAREAVIAAASTKERTAWAKRAARETKAAWTATIAARVAEHRAQSRKLKTMLEQLHEAQLHEAQS